MTFWEQVGLECFLLGIVLVGTLGAIGAPAENTRAMCVLAVILGTGGYCIHITREAQRGRQ